MSENVLLLLRKSLAEKFAGFGYGFAGALIIIAYALGTLLGITVSVELPDPPRGVGMVALRAAEEHGLVFTVLVLDVPLQLGRKVELGGAEGALERGL